MSLHAPDWPRCKRCRKPSHPERRQVYRGENFCSVSCVEAEQESEKDLALDALRVVVLARDHGKCARCPTNTLVLRSELNALMDDTSPGAHGRWTARLLQLTKAGFDEHAVTSRARLWECAHVVARVEGGRDVSENCITLCLSCHKADSAALAAKRADARRPFGRR